MQLLLKNFKCFKYQQIKLNNLTVLVGGNGYGKSSIIQSILLARHSIEKCGVILNGKTNYSLSNRYFEGAKINVNDFYGLTLGSNIAILNRKADDDDINIGFLDDNGNHCLLEYFANEREVKLFIEGSHFKVNGNPNFSIFSRHFYYLSAERDGPRILQKIKNFDYLNVGYRGQYTGQVISENGGYYKLEESKIHRNAPKDKSILKQVNYWLNEIIPGAEVNFTKNSETNTIQILLKNEITDSDFVIAPNIGFGISYALPIIVNGLVAEKNSLYIVENPEAHLHPSAQSKIGEFLGFISNTGVNVIIETHSDHILNGVQLSVINSDISHSDATVIFFNKDRENGFHLTEINFKEDAFLQNWPKGFFDQSQIDFAKIIQKKHQND